MFINPDHQTDADFSDTLLEIDPHFLNSQIGLAWAFAKKKMFREAISVIENIDVSLSDEPNVLTAQGYINAVSGNTETAHQFLQKLFELSHKRFVSAYDIATIYAGLNDVEQAFDWLEKAMNERAVWLVFLKANPRFDSLRHDPRFENLLLRIGFN